MPEDTSDTIPVLVHMDRKDWVAFKKVAGTRRASHLLRKMVKRELAENLVTVKR